MAQTYTRVPGFHTSADVAKQYVFNLGTGNAATATTAGAYRFFNDFDVPLTITGVRATCTTAPASQSILVDVNVDGTTIFTTQANRPAIAAAATTSGAVTNMDVVTIPVGSVLTIDVDQVGSGTVGAGLQVVVNTRS